MPPLGSGVLSFGLVAIPVRIHTAVRDQGISFNLLHEKCGSRVRNRFLCPICNEVVERDHLQRGYEVAKNQYVMFTEEELDSLETEANRNIELKEFVPISKIDPVYFESAYYLGVDAGGDKAYKLLAKAMRETDRAALAEMVTRGKERFVLIRPYQNGLLLQTMFYADEIRDFGQIPKGENNSSSQLELDLGIGLVEKLSTDDFNPEEFEDEYRSRVQAMLDKKIKGQEITISPAAAPSHGVVIDLMDALRQSMERATPKRKAPAARKKRKASQ